MAALVHAYAHTSGTTTTTATTATMFQPRPTPSGRLPSTGGQAQYAGPHAQRASLQPGPAVLSAPALYRSSTGPVPPYAFQHPGTMPMPLWSTGSAGPRPQSMIAFPQAQHLMLEQANMASRPRMQNAATFIHNTAAVQTRSRDDSSLPPARANYPSAPRPQSAYLMAGGSGSIQSQPTQQQQVSPLPSPTLQPPASVSVSVPSGPSKSVIPDRYRRPTLQQQSSHSNSNPSAPANPVATAERPPRPRADSFHQTPRRGAADDMQVNMGSTSAAAAAADEAKRLRRRSMHTLEASDYAHPILSSPTAQAGVRRDDAFLHLLDLQQAKTLRFVKPSGPASLGTPTRPVTSDGSLPPRGGHSRSSSNTSRNGNNHAIVDAPATSARTEELRPVHATLRSPSAEPPRRTPSPLAQTNAADAAGTSRATSKDAPTLPESLAAKQLAALNEKGGGKPRRKPSRLRRALSFGSAVEFRKMTGEAGEGEGEGEIDDSSPANQLGAGQERIAQRQEDRGIGSSIYGRKLFSASTDNLSISSTASSASVMIRKMGRGVKRTSRSFVGLFRPKSSHGRQDSSVSEAGQAKVSMVTAEADTQGGLGGVGVHAQGPQGSPYGLGGLPQADGAAPLGSRGSPSTGSDRTGSGVTENSRKSILGCDRERADVLAAVRKGILKRTGRSTSPSQQQGDRQDSLTSLEPPTLPASTNSPLSSAPSTPNDEAQAQAQKRADTLTIGNEDYFVAAMRLRQDTKSAPASSSATPRGSMKRSATFSPQIVFYDTWPSQEYDRRGEISTCNRLTPLLAQQIKEELNTFKMEMVVHEKSKIYTHFF